MKVVPKKKPTKFREWLSFKIVRLAQWVYPESEAVNAFFLQSTMDQMMYGQSITRIDPSKFKPTQDG